MSEWIKKYCGFKIILCLLERGSHGWAECTFLCDLGVDSCFYQPLDKQFLKDGLI